MRLLAVFITTLFCSLPLHAAEFTFNTNAFLDGVAIPVLYTCDGKDVSPQFSWTDLPAKTQSLALVLADPDAPSGIWYHWVVYDLPKNTAEIEEAIAKLPTGAVSAKNSWGKMQYNGPCPPKGTAHTYVFTLYALDTTLKLPSGTDAATVMKAMTGHILAQKTITGTYTRWVQ